MPKRIIFLELPIGTVAVIVRASVRQAGVIGWNPMESKIFSLFPPRSFLCDNLAKR